MSQQDKSQKTQKPTPKRIREFRKEGKIALSKDLTSTALMVVAGAMALAFAEQAGRSISSLMRVGLTAGQGTELPVVANVGIRALITSCWPTIVGGFLGFFVATGVQLGWPPAFKKIQFKPGKALSFSGIKQLLSIKAAGGRVLKASAKALLVIFVVALAIHEEYQAFLHHPPLEPLAMAQALLRGIGRLGVYSVAVLGVLAAIDFAMQKRKIMQDMMMSIEDVKKEMKQQDGDPKIKGRRRQKMRELAQRRVQAEVAGADVVIVNPTHYSVALRYDAAKEGAPRVVAKGKDEMAAKIREFARKAGVPILSRPPLTRLIYRLAPEGTEIPRELYQTVAEILAYVYRIAPHRRSAS